METRYGKKRSRQVNRKSVALLASVLLTVSVVFIFWAAFAQHNTPTGTATSYVALNSQELQVTIDVKNPAGTPVSCLVSAVNEHESSVGSVQIDFENGTEFAKNLKIITVEPAVGAVVDSCWNH